MVLFFLHLNLYYSPAEAIGTLSTRPQSMEEIANVNAKHHQFGKRRTEVRIVTEECMCKSATLQLKDGMKLAESKNRLLRSVVGQGVESLDNTRQQWERFDLMLDSHQLMIKEQVDVLKSQVVFASKITIILFVLQVATRVDAFNSDMERFAARWHQFKPSNDTLDADRPTVLRAVEFVKEKRQEFEELKAQADKLMCVYSFSSHRS